MAATGLERRKVSWRRLFVRHFIWVPAIPLVVALVLGGFGWHNLKLAQVLELHGVEAVATITNREIRRSRDSEGRERTEYRVYYTFRPATGPAAEGRASVSRTTYNQLTPGTETPVRYVLHDPAISEIEIGGTLWLGRLFMLIAVPIGAVGLGLALWIGRRKVSLLRAARRGEVREARVTAHHLTNVQVNGRSQYRMTWLDAAGVEGQSGMHDLQDLPPEGSVIVVYVDPRSGRGWWEDEF